MDSATPTAPGGDDPLRSALASAPVHSFVEVRGRRIAVRAWESRTSTPERTLLLLHGNGACGAWWDAVGPLLADRARVVAIDLAGHGESDWADRYHLDEWRDDVLEVARILNAPRETVLIGHSMGGLVALKAAWQAPDVFGGFITLDTPLRRFSKEQLAKRHGIGERPPKRFDSLEDAVAGFKTVPPLEWTIDAVVEHVAHRSYRRDGDEWVFHCDPAVYRRVTDVDEFIRPWPEHHFAIRAEHGLVVGDMLDEIAAQLPSPDRLVTVPRAGHNLILEAPLATAWVIEALLSRLG